VDVSAYGLGCPTIAVVGGPLQVTGTWTANPDGTFSDDTVTTGTDQLLLASSCLNVSGAHVTCDRLDGLLTALGYSSVNCMAGAADGCTCSAVARQNGAAAILSSDATTIGNYTSSGNELSLGDSAKYSYCVSGSTMTWTPQSVGLSATGAVVFERSSSGTGGSGASGSSGVGGSEVGGSGVGGSGGTSGSGGATGGSSGSGGGESTSKPCDIYGAASTPCVGAYSTVRALYGAYSGNLYQVRRSSDKSTNDIPTLTPGGLADSSVQDAFCTGACTISILYDQSAQHNDLPVSPKTLWLTNGGTESDAKSAPINVGGHKVYGLKFVAGGHNSYRNLKSKGTATGDQAESMYEVVDSKVYNNACCNDFGNASTDGNPDGAATMEAIYWGNDTLFGSGGGKGPWLLADLEAGTFGGQKADNPANTPIVTPAFASLVLKGFSGNRYAMKGGDAQTGSLVTKYDGARPSNYSPMKKQGSIVLGTGGDGSFYSTGIFFEGAITIGCADDTKVDDAIQSSIVAAGYGH
jgi:hypothetical protein